MKNAVARFGFIFALAASLFAEGAATNGNCMEAAVKITPSSSEQTVTLVREWDPYGGPNGTGDWSDEGHKEDAIGVKWFYADLTKGKNYVIWMDEKGVGYNDMLGMRMDVNYDDANAPESQFADYTGPDGTNYLYITTETGDMPGQWVPDDPGTCRFYLCFSDNDVGKSAKLYFEEKAISSYAPSGSALNPITLSVSQSGSKNVIKVPGEETHYKFTAEPGYHYVFTCTSHPTNMPTISLDSVSGNEEFVSEEYREDSTSGTYIYDFSITNESMTAVIKVAAEDPSLCTLSWVRSDVGTAGFVATFVEVRDDAGYANLEVFRTSADSALRYVWMTVAETAVPGVDYIPCSGVLTNADGELSTIISVPLIPGGVPEEGAKVFAVRLMQVDEGELGEGEYSPPPISAVTRVVITPTGAAEPEPDVPEAMDEDEDTALSTGTFDGVLTSENGAGLFAETRISSSNGTLSATVILDGHEYSFAGSGNMLSGSMTVGGTPFDAVLNFIPPSGTVADLYDGPGGAASVSGFLYVEAQGAAEEVFFSGNLYRVESRLDTATLDVMSDKAGRYVTALGADWQPGVTDTNGYLVVDVAADGSAIVTGELPDGTAIVYAGYANDTTNGLALPIAWRSGSAAIGGTLMLDGEYDYWSSLDRLYSGWVLVVNDAESPFDGLELYAEDEVFFATDTTTAISFDRTSGVISGDKDGNSFTAVLLTAAQANEAGVVGFATDGSGNVVPFSMQRVWTDPSWSENWGVEVTVSFDANGGTGSMDDMHATLVQTIELPPCAFTKANCRFVGWRHPYSGEIIPSGAKVNVPATDSVFLAMWEDVRLKAALDCDSLAFSWDDEANWDNPSDGSATNGTCMAVRVVKGKTASITFTAPCDGTLAFNMALTRYVDWSSGNGNDRWDVFVDGVVVTSMTQNAGWTTMSGIKVSSGQTVEWRFTAHTLGNSQKTAASAKLDAVVWEPDVPSGVLVTFDAGEYGASSVTNVYLPAGEAIGQLPTATRAGCEFIGWFTRKGVMVTESYIVPKLGVNLSAKWSATASFDANGNIVGSVPVPMTVEADKVITLPGALTHVSSDFEFLGWRLGNVVYDAGASSDPIVSNVTFIAEWQDNRPVVTITLDANGGACVETNIAAKAGDEIDTLPTPTLGGAVFVAWYAGNERVTLPYVVERTNTTFTAHWGVTLTFDGGGASGAGPVDIAAEPGDMVVLPGCGDLTLANHTFAGWTDGNARYKEGAEYKVTTSATLTAVWKNAYYNTPLDNDDIDFSSGNDSLWDIVSDASAVNGDCLSVRISRGITASLTFTAPCDGTLSFNLALTRYVDWSSGNGNDRWDVFVDGVAVTSMTQNAGWTTMSGIEVFGGQTIEWRFSAHTAGYNQKTAANAKLDAVVWEPQDPSRVLVTFDAGEYGVSSVTSAYHTAGEPIGMLPTATRGGCDFDAWVDSNDEEVSEAYTVPEGGVTLFAKWSATASFDANGNIAGSVPVPMTVEADKSFTLPGALTHASSDFEFIGWRLGNVVYDAGASSDPIMSNVTFVAEWQDNRPVVTITLDANGGACVETNIAAKAGDEIDALPTPTLDGAVFVAWYAGNERVTLPYVVGTNATFTAHWGVTLTFDGGGATGTPPTDIAAESGDQVVLPGHGDLALANHSFAGWTDGNARYKEGAKYKVTTSATFTAVWKNAFYNTPLDNDDLEFSSSNDSYWSNVYDSTARNGACLSVNISKGITPSVTFTAPCDGTLAFNLSLTRYVDWSSGNGNDRWDVLVGGNVVDSLTVDSRWKSISKIEVARGQTVEWRFSAHTGGFSQKTAANAKLDAVEWTPKGISTAPGSAFEDADEAELEKATTWMETWDLTAEDMNTLQFSEGKSGDPLDDLATAYLLNCAPTSEAIEAAKAAFKVTSFSVGADGEISIAPSDVYGNGKVELFYATSPDGTYSADRPVADSLFIRLHLVK